MEKLEDTAQAANRRREQLRLAEHVLSRFVDAADAFLKAALTVSLAKAEANCRMDDLQ